MQSQRGVKGAVVNAIEGRRERLELCPLREVILCGCSAGRRTGFRGWGQCIKIPHACTCVPVSYEDQHDMQTGRQEDTRTLNNIGIMMFD